MAAAAGAEGSLVTLLTGEETFLRDRRVAELAAARTPPNNAAYNVDVFQGPEVDLSAVVAACDTLPILDEHRLVVVRDLDLTAAGAHEGFLAYLRKPNPSTQLLISAGAQARPRRKPKAKAKGKAGAKSKAATGPGEIIALASTHEEFAALRADRAAQFLRDAARVRQIEISPEASRELIELVGVDAGRLDSEIEKAAIYTGGNRIEAHDIEALAWRSRGHTMFEVTDAMATGDRRAMLSHLGALFEDGNDALAIIGMVAWHMRRTLRAAALLEEGATSGQVARAIGLRWGTADAFTATAKALGTLGAARAIRALREADRLIKSTPEDKRRVVERTLLDFRPA